MQVHAEGEAEHAAIGHAAVVGFVPAQKQEILRRAMMDHGPGLCSLLQHTG